MREGSWRSSLDRAALSAAAHGAGDGRGARRRRSSAASHALTGRDEARVARQIVAEDRGEAEEAARERARDRRDARRRCARSRPPAGRRPRSRARLRRRPTRSASSRRRPARHARSAGPRRDCRARCASSRCGSFCEPSIAICCVRCGSAGLPKRSTQRRAGSAARSTPAGSASVGATSSISRAHQRDEVRLRRHLVDRSRGPRESRDTRAPNGCALSSRSFIASNGATSATNCAPACSQPGAPRRTGPRSPIAGTARTPPAPTSSTPSAARRFRDVGVAWWRARCGRPSSTGTSRWPRSTRPARHRAAARTRARALRPDGRCAAGCRSRGSSAARRPPRARRASASTSRPTAETGSRPGARDRARCRDARDSSSPVAGSWQ